MPDVNLFGAIIGNNSHLLGLSGQTQPWAQQTTVQSPAEALLWGSTSKKSGTVQLDQSYAVRDIPAAWVQSVDSFYGPTATAVPNRVPTRQEVEQFFAVNMGRRPTAYELKYYAGDKRPVRFAELIQGTGQHRQASQPPPTPVQFNPGPGLGTRSHTREDVAANYPDYRPGAISMDPNNPSQTIADIVRREEQRYDYFYRPVEDELIGSLRDTSIVDRARENAGAGTTLAAERAARQRARYGMQQTALEEQQSERQRGLHGALNFDATVNDARIEQKERNDGLRRQLIDIGRGVAGDAMDGLSSAANNQAQRDINNASARAANRARNIGTAGSVASAALMAFLV